MKLLAAILSLSLLTLGSCGQPVQRTCQFPDKSYSNCCTNQGGPEYCGTGGDYYFDNNYVVCSGNDSADTDSFCQQ